MQICVLDLLVQIHMLGSQQHLHNPHTVKLYSKKTVGLHGKDESECSLGKGVLGCYQHPSLEYLDIDLHALLCYRTFVERTDMFHSDCSRA